MSFDETYNMTNTKLCLKQRRTWILVAILFLFASSSPGVQQNEITISTPEEIKAEFDSVPCKNEERLTAVKTLFCQMINIDSLGLSAPQVADNMSSKKLREFTGELAKEMKMPFDHASIEGADSDSSSFVRKKIPAVTIHGLSNEFTSLLHSKNDQSTKVNSSSVS